MTVSFCKATEMFWVINALSKCPADKPSLQSRHSLDSAKAQEAGPLWITLALQKQKGFRDQQQSREDRRSHREIKLAVKQARERESVRRRRPHVGEFCPLT